VRLRKRGREHSLQALENGLSSTVRMEAELRWREPKIWSLIEYAKPVRSSILDSSVKHKIAPGKEFEISRKRERYTVVIEEFLGHLHSLKTMLGGVMAHGGTPGTMGSSQ